MTTEQAPLTTQARYKQILTELAELYERREHFRRERRAGEASDVAETPDEGPIVKVLEGGLQAGTPADPVHRERMKAQLVLIFGGRTDA